MRLAWDGMPKELPLTREARRALRMRIAALRPEPSPKLLPFIPATVMLACTGIWMPVLHSAGTRWGMVAIGGSLVLQIIATTWLMWRLMWPWKCRQMARAGYEVCPKCGYPQTGPGVAEGGRRECQECGADRVVV